MIVESKPDSDVKRAGLPGGRSLLILGCAMVAGFSMIVTWSSIDRRNRPQFESWEQATGVEDRLYFSTPDKITPPMAVAAKLGGKTLYLLSRDPVGIHDSDVRRVAKDVATGLTIYQAADRKFLPPKERRDTYLLKVEIGRYVRVRISDGKDPQDGK